MSISAYSEGDVPVPGACLDNLTFQWSVSDISGEWQGGKAVELSPKVNAPKFLIVPAGLVAPMTDAKIYKYKISVTEENNA